MTVKQFRKAVNIARRYGTAKLGDGLTLDFTGWYFAIRRGKNTVDVADDPRNLEYLFD